MLLRPHLLSGSGLTRDYYLPKIWFARIRAKNTCSQIRMLTSQLPRRVSTLKLR